MALRRLARAFTLVEILTGAYVACLVLAVILTIFVLGRRTFHSAQSSILLSREMGTAMLQLRRDLEDSSLGSVHVQDGLSLATPRDFQKTGEIQLQPSGAPFWTGHVLYALDGSKLVRWVRLQSSVLPLRSPVSPWPVQGAVRQQVVMRNLLPRGRALREVDGRWTVVDDVSSPGGFVARFVRRETRGRTLSADNPAAFTDSERQGWSAGNTLLVEVDLTVLEVNSETGAVNSLEFDVRVVPRN